MGARFILQPGRIILSQPGFVATFGMPDSQKIFDSDWNWSGVVLETGEASGYAGQVVSGAGGTVIQFKKNYGYRPVCFVTQLVDGGAWGPGWDFFSEISQCAAITGPGAVTNLAYVYPDRVELNKSVDFSKGPLRWYAYGVD